MAMMIKGLKPLLCEEKLEKAETAQPRKAKTRGDLLNLYKYLKRGCREGGASPFQQCPPVTRKWVQLKHRRLPLNIMKHSLNESCNGLNQRACRTSFWKYSKARETSSWVASSTWGGGWTRLPPEVPSNFSLSVVLYSYVPKHSLPKTKLEIV